MEITLKDILDALKELNLQVPSWLNQMVWWYKWGAIVGLVVILGIAFIIILDSLNKNKKSLIYHIVLHGIYLIFPITFLAIRYNVGFLQKSPSFYIFILISSLIAPIISILHLIYYLLTRSKEVVERETIHTWTEEETRTFGEETEETPTEGLGGIGGEIPVDETISIKRRKLPVIAWLVMTEGERTGEDFKIDKTEFKIGRDPNLGCDLILNDPTVSREHAKIKVTEDRDLIIYDLGSENGVVVNGREIEEPTKLNDGDEIVIGKTKFILKILNKGGKK